LRSACCHNEPLPFNLQIGAYASQAETKVRLDGSGGALGTSLSFEGDLGVEDLAAAELVVRKAKEQGVGTEVEF